MHLLHCYWKTLGVKNNLKGTVLVKSEKFEKTPVFCLIYVLAYVILLYKYYKGAFWEKYTGQICGNAETQSWESNVTMGCVTSVLLLL